MENVEGVKYCDCKQNDSVVILPDNTKYCMLCGHKRKVSISESSQSNVDNDDSDDVIIVKEEKRRGSGKRKTAVTQEKERVSQSNATVHIPQNKSGVSKPSQNNLPGVQKSVVRTINPPKVNLINTQVQNVMKVKFPSIQLMKQKQKNSTAALRENSRKVTISDNEKLRKSAGAGMYSTAVIVSRPDGSNAYTNISRTTASSVYGSKAAGASLLLQSSAKPINPTPSTTFPVITSKLIAIGTNQAKDIDNPNDSMKRKISNEIVRKSKRAKKATTRFSDCVTVNLKNDSSSSEVSDDDDEGTDSASESEDSDEDRTDEDICHVCMSYEPPIEFEQGYNLESFGLKWIDCDGCHRWFHWFCVGIFDATDTKFFKCKTCRSQQM